MAGPEDFLPPSFWAASISCLFLSSSSICFFLAWASASFFSCSSLLIFSSSALFCAACFFSCSARISFLAACLSLSLFSSASSLERSSRLKKLLKNAGVFGFVPCDCHQACLGIFHHAGNVVVPVLQNLQPRRVEHIAALDLLLQVNLLLLPLVILHDLQPLLLNKPPLLDVELFLGLRVDLFGFLIGFLLNEGHHVLDLLLHIAVRERHLQAFLLKLSCRSESSNKSL